MAKSLHLHFVPGTMCDERLWHYMLPLLDDVSVSHSDYRNATTEAEMISCVAGQIPCGAHLVGFSLGGYLAAQAVLNHGSHVKSLTLIATATGGLAEDEKKLRLQNADLLRRTGYKGMSRKRLAQFVHGSNMDNGAIVDIIHAMERDLGPVVLVNQLIATAERQDLKTQLPGLEMPLFLIAAEKDRMVPLSSIRETAALAASSKLAVLTGQTGHMIPLEAPRKLANFLRDTVLSKKSRWKSQDCDIPG